MKYFTYDEFDSPDQPGSGQEMEPIFLEKLDLARELSGVPYVINSGYRTEYWNQKVGGRVGSSHLTGLIEAGFDRIGVGTNFIHVDCDPSKAGNVTWLY